MSLNRGSKCTAWERSDGVMATTQMMIVPKASRYGLLFLSFTSESVCGYPPERGFHKKPPGLCFPSDAGSINHGLYVVILVEFQPIGFSIVLGVASELGYSRESGNIAYAMMVTTSPRSTPKNTENGLETLEPLHFWVVSVLRSQSGV